MAGGNGRTAVPFDDSANDVADDHAEVARWSRIALAGVGPRVEPRRVRPGIFDPRRVESGVVSAGTDVCCVRI